MEDGVNLLSFSFIWYDAEMIDNRIKGYKTNDPILWEQSILLDEFGRGTWRRVQGIVVEIRDDGSYLYKKVASANGSLTYQPVPWTFFLDESEAVVGSASGPLTYSAAGLPS